MSEAIGSRSTTLMEVENALTWLSEKFRSVFVCKGIFVVVYYVPWIVQVRNCFINLVIAWSQVTHICCVCTCLCVCHSMCVCVYVWISVQELSVVEEFGF